MGDHEKRNDFDFVPLLGTGAHARRELPLLAPISPSPNYLRNMRAALHYLKHEPIPGFHHPWYTALQACAERANADDPFAMDELLASRKWLHTVAHAMALYPELPPQERVLGRHYIKGAWDELNDYILYFHEIHKDLADEFDLPSPGQLDAAFDHMFEQTQAFIADPDNGVSTPRQHTSYGEQVRSARARGLPAPEAPLPATAATMEDFIERHATLSSEQKNVIAHQVEASIATFLTDSGKPWVQEVRDAIEKELGVSTHRVPLMRLRQGFNSALWQVAEASVKHPASPAPSAETVDVFGHLRVLAQQVRANCPQGRQAHDLPDKVLIETLSESLPELVEAGILRGMELIEQERGPHAARITNDRASPDNPSPQRG